MNPSIPSFAQSFASQLVTASRNHFSGRLTITAKTATWHIFFRLGRIVWCEGGVHPVRRWLRLCRRYLPEVKASTIAVSDTSQLTGSYPSLCGVVQQNLATRAQLQASIMDVAMEVTFDILLAAEQQTLDYVQFADESPSQSLALLKIKDVFSHGLQQWEAWQQAELGEYSPNWAPSVVSPDRLRQIVSPQAAHRLMSLATGDRSLRDLAVALERDLLRLSRSLLGGVRQGALALIEIDDAERPAVVQTTAQAENQAAQMLLASPEGLISDRPVLMTTSGHPLQAAPRGDDDRRLGWANPPSRSMSPVCQDVLADTDVDDRASGSGPTIVHIDDSPQNCGIARSILEPAGYRYVDVHDPLQAIPTLLQTKPQLVVLDLMMPVINGYELCSQIRRVSSLQDLPIVMLTSQDGIVDRVRAKVVKASAFLSKPINPTKLLGVVGEFVPLKTLS